ncbi:response regulator [Hydrogenophaga sp.]|uniref:response regulator n=1 Tax=Hydrogenophaga sp. TaxID=1904254 RepID=UPI0025C1F050|nr:response regulator [Hydrogenophaga sp.]MBT9463012.1 response regulator [Hydrogenophaga sp.]
MVNLSRLLKMELLRARTDERPSIDFLYADSQSKQLGRGWHMSRAERGQIKVFIVDDNEDAANLLGEAMEYYGYQTLVAFDGAEALDAIGMAKPDVAVLDLGMPGMSGVELAQRLRETRASGDLLLIALTGWGQQEAGEASKSAGFDFHFVKPADPGTLSALIDEEAFRRRVAGRI